MSDLQMKNGMLYSNELRKLAKAMNQRMVELEKRGFKSPAYQSVQARLEALGRIAKTAQGRRFSESGYFANKNEAAQVEAILKRFKHQETSSLKGYRKYRKDVLKGLQERYNYKQSGITDDEMMEFWEAMPDDERERMYGSDETFMIVMKFLIDRKQGKIKKVNLNDYTMQEIVDTIQKQKSLTDALKALGIDTREYMDFKAGKIQSMGEL